MRELMKGAVALIFLTIACFFQPLQTQCVAAGPEFISVEQLKSLLDSQTDMVVVDTRSKTRYESGHIPGAISMLYPHDILTENHRLPRDKAIIFY